ncbi:TPA: hypothetical protein ACHICQ_004970, partial [Enterobacter roggenkampii]
ALKSVRQVLTDEGCLENVKTSHVNPVFLSRQGITDSFEREADKVNLSHFCIVPEVDIGELGNPSESPRII